MVVLTPTQDGERMKVCTRCSHLGLGSRIKERTSFYRRGERGYKSICRWCNAAAREAFIEKGDTKARYRVRKRERYARRQIHLSSEEREAQRTLWREASERQRERDPVGARRSGRRYQQTTRKENRRIDRWEALEAQGIPLKSYDEVRITTGTPRNGVTYPPGPFRAWIRHLLSTEGGYAQVAALLEVTPRRIGYWLNGLTTVNEGLLERVCTRHGGIHPHEVYENFSEEGSGEAPLPYGRRTCGTPGCDEVTTERFCAVHAERLSRWRNELETEAAIISANAMSRRGDLRGGDHPICTQKGCFEPRWEGHDFCDACETVERSRERDEAYS